MHFWAITFLDEILLELNYKGYMIKFIYQTCLKFIVNIKPQYIPKFSINQSK